MTIWKFHLERTEFQDIGMPVGAKVLHVGMQDSEIVVWAMVDPAAAIVRRSFAVVGTGRPIPPGAEYRATVFDGPFVWHIFEPAS